MIRNDGWRRRGARVGTSVGAALMATMALGASSAAAASNVEVTPEGLLTFAAPAGEANDVVMFPTPTPSGPTAGPHIQVRDRVGITSASCPPANRNTVLCSDAYQAVIANPTPASIDLGDGDDIFSMGMGKQSVIDAGPGNDTVKGSSRGGNRRPGDVLRGGPGNDSLNGAGDNDEVDGGDGDDQIFARGVETGVDTITCGPGTDTVYYDPGVDRLMDPENCENQNPTPTVVPNEQLPPPPVASGATAPTAPAAPAGVRAPNTSVETACTNSIRGTRGRDVLRGALAGERLFGLGGNDRLSGGAGDDCLIGGSGNDRLAGGTGNDGLAGSSGNDRLNGGPGTDRVLGGSGNDVVFARDQARDTVNCGSGRRDRATVDRADVVRGCERVVRR